MKKTLLTTLLLISISCFVFGQSNKEEIDLIQSVFGKEKKEMAAEFIKLEGAQKDAFWKTYDEYETERKELGRKRLDLLDRYVTEYKTLDDEGTDKMIKEIISLQTDNDKLIATYYSKMKKGAGTRAAAQFYQFEGYFLSKIRTEIMENIPLIGEFDAK